MKSILNAQQWKLIGAMLLGSTGPIAWLLSHKLGLSDADTKMWLDFIAAFTPLLAGVFITATQTNAAQSQAVATMPPEEKATAFANLSDKDQASIAAALPDKAVVVAAGTVPGVQVHAQLGVAPQAVMDAALDPKVPDVVMMTGGPVQQKDTL